MKIGKIEKNIPVLPRGSTGKYIDVLRQLGVGESFLVMVEKDEEGRQIQRSLSVCVSRFNKDNGIKCIHRKVKEGFRIWRIS